MAASARSSGVGIPQQGTPSWGSDVDEEAVDASAAPVPRPQAAKAVVASSGGSTGRFLNVDSASLMRTFQFRKAFQLNDKVRAYVGTAYDLQKKCFSPVGGLTYSIGDGMVAELTDSRALLSKRWVMGDASRLAVHLKAECRVQLKELPGLQRSLQPALHLSCEQISPLPYQLLAMGLVLVGGLPLHLKNQEIKIPQLPGLSRLGALGRLTLHREGRSKAHLSLWEGATILTV